MKTKVFFLAVALLVSGNAVAEEPVRTTNMCIKQMVVTDEGYTDFMQICGTFGMLKTGELVLLSFRPGTSDIVRSKFSSWIYKG